jgi:orotidine-5'-phosphate decarboxylase
MPAQRIIVAADFRPTLPGKQGRFEVREKILRLGDQLIYTGAVLKCNSAIRALGYDLIDELHELGLGVFADLKLIDIKNTLETDGAFLSAARPEMVTVMCAAGLSGVEKLRKTLPDTEVLGVTVLSNLTDADCNTQMRCGVSTATTRLATIAQSANLDGIICAPGDLRRLRNTFSGTLAYVTPNVRPVWARVDGDDQNRQRTMTPARAIAAGARRVVVGRPITCAESPYDAFMRTIDEIVPVC